jgi:hypothetical protein
MSSQTHRVRVKFQCRSGHGHDMCVIVGRGVPPELRCPPEEPQGYGGGGGGGCSVPAHLAELVERELRDSLQENRRRGYVLVVE